MPLNMPPSLGLKLRMGGRLFSIGQSKVSALLLDRLCQSGKISRRTGADQRLDHVGHKVLDDRRRSAAVEIDDRPGAEGCTLLGELGGLEIPGAFASALVHGSRS
jgi:hypothetical protein